MKDWQKLGKCNSNIMTSTQLFFKLCLNNTNSFSISDLETPISLFTQGLKSGLCVYMNNAPVNISNFIVKNTSNLTDFKNNLLNSFSTIDPIFNQINYFKNYSYFNFTIPSLYNSINLISNSINISQTNYIMNYTVISF